jgi:hypothetical protein
MTIAQETAEHTTWRAALVAAVASGNASAWDVARLYAESDRHPGWSEEAQEITGLSERTLQEYAQTFRRWGQARLSAVPFSLYREVATLDDAAARRLLGMGLSQLSLREEVKKVQQIAGLNPAQLAKVDKVVKYATKQANDYNDQHLDEVINLPVIQQEARSKVIADLQSGKIAPVESYAPLTLYTGTDTAVLQARDLVVQLRGVRSALASIHVPASMKAEVASAIAETIAALEGFQS